MSESATARLSPSQREPYKAARERGGSDWCVTRGSLAVATGLDRDEAERTAEEWNRKKAKAVKGVLGK